MTRTNSLNSDISRDVSIEAPRTARRTSRESHVGRIAHKAKHSTSSAMRSLRKKGSAVKRSMKIPGSLIQCASHGEKPTLEWAITHNDPKLLKFLISRGADVNTKNSDGETPLHLAILSGKEAMAGLLLENGADANATNSLFGESPLHTATYKRNISMMQLLLDNGADVNAKNTDGQTPLFENSWDPAIANFLIENGADVNAQDNNGSTPLHDAARGKKIRTIEILIENGGDWNLKNHQNRTFLEGRRFDDEELEQIKRAIEKRIIEDNLPAFMALNQVTEAHKEENASVFNGRWNPIHRALMQGLTEDDEIVYFDDQGNIQLH